MNARLKPLGWIAFSVLSLLFALYATRNGITGWDSEDQFRYSHLIGAKLFGLESHGDPITWFDVQWYGPLWEATLAFFEKTFGPVFQNPHWLRSALTFSYFLFSGAWAYRLLRSFSFGRAEAALAALSIYGVIRLGGHALFNTKDAVLAITCLLATLLMWRYRSSRALFLAAMVPALIRLPMVFHLMAAVVLSRLVSRRKFTEMALILCGIAGVLVVCTPGFWSSGFVAWVNAIAGFSRWHWTGDIRYFGTTINNQNLPFYYYLLWFPVALSPVILATSLAGIAALFRPLVLEKPIFAEASLVSRRFFAFLWSMTAVLFAAVMLVQPKIFDEERHILFLVVHVAFTATLTAAHAFRTKLEKAAPVVLPVMALAIAAEYAEWGRFAYVYKSRLIMNRSAERFMGDYTGICVGDALRRIVLESPDPVHTIGIQGPLSSARLHIDQLKRETPLARDARVDWANFDRDEFIISINRIGTQNALRDQIGAGRYREIFRIDMPPGEPACLVARKR